jgi:hypothetical protein
MKNSILYALMEPFSSEIRYIGKTTQTMDERFRGHMTDARSEIFNHKNNWIRSLLSKKQMPAILILKSDYSSHDELITSEITMIAYCKSIGINLVNSTGGGEGMIGFKHKKESNMKNADAHRGKIHSEESKEKRRISMTGRTTPIEIREKMSKSHFGIVPDEEARVRMSESAKRRPSNRKGAKLTDLQKKNISDGHKKRKRDKDIIS